MRFFFNFSKKTYLNYFDFSEIGACLVDLDSGEIEDRFQSYVRPTLFPKLSPFCIRLTGIQQDLIDRQETFPAIYSKLANWIDRIETEKHVRFASSLQRNAGANGVNATFASWSDTDLKIFFKMECRRLSIAASPGFKAWIDVRRMFDVSSLKMNFILHYAWEINLKCFIGFVLSSHLQLKYPMGRCKFARALQCAGIDTIGQAHSAINDAENLAKLVVHLTKRGAPFSVATNCCDHSAPMDYSY